MAETLAELQAQKLRVDNAIAQLINGESILEFEIGSGATRRKYKFGDVTMEALQVERNRIAAELTQLGIVETTFRRSSVMRTSWSKF